MEWCIVGFTQLIDCKGEYMVGGVQLLRMAERRSIDSCSVDTVVANSGGRIRNRRTGMGGGRTAFGGG